MLEHLLVVAYGTAEVIAHAPAEKDRFLASQSFFSLGHVFERLTDFRHRNWFCELPGSLRYASLLSEVPSHGQFLFREVDRSTKEVKLLSATEVTDLCEKAKDAYKKLRTSTYVLHSVLFVIQTSHVCFSSQVEPNKLPPGKRETRGRSGRRPFPLRVDEHQQPQEVLYSEEEDRRRQVERPFLSGEETRGRRPQSRSRARRRPAEEEESGPVTAVSTVATPLPR
jgi:hypothetical protein